MLAIVAAIVLAPLAIYGAFLALKLAGAAGIGAATGLVQLAADAARWIWDIVSGGYYRREGRFR